MVDIGDKLEVKILEKTRRNDTDGFARTSDGLNVFIADGASHIGETVTIEVTKAFGRNLQAKIVEG